MHVPKFGSRKTKLAILAAKKREENIRIIKLDYDSKLAVAYLSLHRNHHHRSLAQEGEILITCIQELRQPPFVSELCVQSHGPKH